MNHEEIIKNAFNVAKNVEENHRAKIDEHKTYHGFSWVVVRPFNCEIAKILKEKYNAERGFFGGVIVWDPGRTDTLSVTIKEEGARAFATALQDAGIRATVGSRAEVHFY